MTTTTTTTATSATTVPGVCFVDFIAAKPVLELPNVPIMVYFCMCSCACIATPPKCREVKTCRQVNADWLKLLEYIVLSCCSFLVRATRSAKSRKHPKNHCPSSGW